MKNRLKYFYILQKNWRKNALKVEKIHGVILEKIHGLGKIVQAIKVKAKDHVAQAKHQTKKTKKEKHQYHPRHQVKTSVNFFLLSGMFPKKWRRGKL